MEPLRGERRRSCDVTHGRRWVLRNERLYCVPLSFNRRSEASRSWNERFLWFSITSPLKVHIVAQIVDTAVYLKDEHEALNSEYSQLSDVVSPPADFIQTKAHPTPDTRNPRRRLSLSCRAAFLQTQFHDLRQTSPGSARSVLITPGRVSPAEVALIRILWYCLMSQSCPSPNQMHENSLQLGEKPQRLPNISPTKKPQKPSNVYVWLLAELFLCLQNLSIKGNPNL